MAHLPGASGRAAPGGSSWEDGNCPLMLEDAAGQEVQESSAAEVDEGVEVCDMGDAFDVVAAEAVHGAVS